MDHDATACLRAMQALMSLRRCIILDGGFMLPM
jgi:hypothetical protein